jgi:hypothetical protein
VPIAHTRSTMGVKNDPRHISGTTAPRNKISTAIPDFRGQSFNSANADFLSHDPIPEINMATVKMQDSCIMKAETKTKAKFAFYYD